MSEVLVLDILLVVLLVGYAIYGFTHGLLGSLAVVLGAFAGVVVAFFVAPQVAGWVPFPGLRPFATIAVALVIIGLGNGLGVWIGRGIRRGMRQSALSALDRLVGGLVTFVVAALVVSVLAFSVVQLGVPFLSRAVAGSTVVRVIDTVTPDPVQAWLAQLRGVVVDEGIPLITEALKGDPPEIPQIDTGSPALNAAAQSVVRVTGNAIACGQSQSGTGFVVAPGRIVTNAHVVAGVTEPVVEALDGDVAGGRIVYFDPVDDLAVIAVEGFDVEPLQIGDTLSPGLDAAVQGYPHGGPFTAGAAQVVAVGQTRIVDIYGSGGTLREIYTLAANVQEGNSGGPLLSTSGEVVGVVFARSAQTQNVGFAMTMAELDPVVDVSAGLTAPVGSGDCIRG
ncbi:MAG: MarP family serine protease [Actinomycetota bacterium]|nr:MarP family serine protease [Actinomycetota bacterium]